MNQHYERTLKMVTETPWAIRPEVLAVIVDLLTFRSSGKKLTEEEIRERIGITRAEESPLQMQGSVAVLPLRGVIVPKASMFSDISGATSLDRFVSVFRKAQQDEDVSAIVLDVDSPGGMVDLVPEVGQEIRSARGGSKPIVAVANTQAASAAYWIASQADRLVVTPSGEVGSIGVFSSHEDFSKFEEIRGVKTTLISAGKYKTEGNPFEALTEDARGAIQQKVNEFYEMFVGAVAKGRGTTTKAVRTGFGEGRMVTAKAAAKEGMVDQVATLDQVVAELQRGKPLKASAKRVSIEVTSEPSPVADRPIPHYPEDPPKPEAPAAEPGFFTRAYPLSDIAIRSDGTGRTVEAYAAVFNQVARVTDFYRIAANPFEDDFGTYDELLRPVVFNKSLADRGKNFPVIYNHGRDLFGVPSERFAMPVGTPLEVRVDGKGLVTVIRYAKTDLADEVLQLIHEEAIRWMSFGGKPLVSKVHRSMGQNGFDLVERVEVALKEFGPCLFPYYSGAEIVSVRAEAFAQQLSAMNPQEREHLIDLLRGTPAGAAIQGTRGNEPHSENDTPTGPSVELLASQAGQRKRNYETEGV